MIFAEPIPFKEALESRAVKSALPTRLTSREIRDRISAEIRERANFSARTTSAEYLDTIDREIAKLLNGETDQATARLALKNKIAQLGGAEEIGETGEGIRDLGSDLRLDLILETNVEAAQGYGGWIQGQDEAILDQWPAQELIRVIDPAGAARDWPARWAEVGGETFNGRMIALKNDPIWERLGSEFDDGLGNPYPPFAFNSGMDVQDVDRDEAMAFGLIDRDTAIKPQERGFNDDLKYAPRVRSDALREVLTSAGDMEFDDGVLSLKGRAA